MSSFDTIPRIDKTAFLASNLVVFVLCIISIIARFYVRIRVQRQFSIDDGTLLFGFACLITSIVLLFINVDRLYIIGSIYTGATDLQIPSDIKQQAAEFNKLILAEAVLTWCSIVSVKFSYLFLFKRLINRIRPLVKYWWFTVVVNIMISVYVPITYVFACDPYNDTIIVTCRLGSGLHKTTSFVVSQMVFDVVGDFLILYIPCRLIWKLKIKLIQKLALAFTLCLTILTIICTVIRVAGISTGRTVRALDIVWMAYWQFIAANIAVTMTAVTAFRTLFVSAVGGNGESPSPESSEKWYTKGRGFVRCKLSRPLSWRFRRRAGNNRYGSRNDRPPELSLHAPRAAMTGIRTFIHGQGRTGKGGSQLMRSMVEEGSEKSLPLYAKDTNSPSIMVRHDLAVTCENL